MFQIVVIRDIPADVWSRPFFHATTHAAVREFGDAVNKGDDSPLSLHPGDFEMFHFGAFDDSAGRFVLFDKPVHLVHGTSLLRSGGRSNVES